MRQISYQDYFDKTLGGWIGKSIGGTVGWFEGTKRITGFDIFELLPKGMVANDDLDVQLVWLDAILDKGIYLTGSDLMEAWVREYDYNFGEYGYARRNWLRGIEPPVSGMFANDYYITGMGCPIRAEIWGMICPGRPDLAASYAETDGMLDHAGESVWAEQFIAAMEAEAFFESEIEKLLEKGRNYLPEGSVSRRCVDRAIECFDTGMSWQDAWGRLRDDFGHPDCTYSPFNMGITVLALLYGGGNLEKTLGIAVNAGWDVDCTCSTTAALIGIIYGKKGFSGFWLDYLGDKVVTLARPVHPMGGLSLISEYTARAGVTLSRENPGCLISEIPDGLEPVPTVKYHDATGIVVDYCGMPEIGRSESKEIKLLFTNQSDKPFHGYFDLALPDGWYTTVHGNRIRLEPGENVTAEFVLAVPPNLELLPDKNIVGVSVCNEAENTMQKKSFGICGKPECLMTRPAFDSYEDWLPEVGLPANRWIKTPGYTAKIPEAGEEWGNHRIRLSHPYIEEDFPSPEGTRRVFAGARPCNASADSVRISDAYGLKGTCCVYCLREVVSPQKRLAHLFIGSTDPYVLWFNGTKLLEQNDNRFWYPNNEIVEVELRKGINQIVIKMLRTGADNRFSLVFRHKPVLKGFDSCPFITDLSSKALPR